MKYYYVYIMTNKPYGTLYIGVTNNLLRRVNEHKEKSLKGFSQKYDTTKLVYYEQCEDIHSAITREKQLKKWNRLWKINLIIKENSYWEDLYYKL